MGISINGLQYVIVEVDNIESKDDTHVIGCTDYINQKILILKSLSKEQKKITLRHELCHAFLWAYGLGSLDTYSLEIVCDFLGIYSEQIVNISNEYFNRETTVD